MADRDASCCGRDRRRSSRLTSWELVCVCRWSSREGWLLIESGGTFHGGDEAAAAQVHQAKDASRWLIEMLLAVVVVDDAARGIPAGGWGVCRGSSCEGWLLAKSGDSVHGGDEAVAAQVHQANDASRGRDRDASCCGRGRRRSSRHTSWELVCVCR